MPQATLALAAAAGALLVAGCGGGSRQDAGEPAATFAMEVLHPSFPAAQSIARQTSFVESGEKNAPPSYPGVFVILRMSVPSSFAV